jgi:aldose 1-epimerase
MASATVTAPTVSPARVEGFDAITLSSGPLEATFVPAVGLVGASLRHEGEELLGQRDGVGAYAATAATMGLPLLHPWANRLSEERYAAGGRTAQLPAGLPREEHGLAIHGLPPQPFRVRAARASGRTASLHATLDFPGHPAFPFAHRLEQAISLGPDALRIETTLRGAAPVAFGFHPYLTLPGAPRAEWVVELPERERLLADARLIPTGERVPEPAERAPLGARTFDDGFALPGHAAAFVASGGGRTLTVSFAAGYPLAQVYAPADDDVICFEPMTAPTNALVTGDGLPLVAPGGAYRAAFDVRVR